MAKGNIVVQQETTLLTTIIVALVLFGLLMVYSTSGIDPSDAGNMRSQAKAALIGCCIMFIAARFDYHNFERKWLFKPLVLATLALLVLVLVPGIGVDVNGARRWIRLAGFQFQPSELAKFALIMLLAVKLSQNRDDVRTFWRGFVPTMILAALFAGLVVLENDLGIPFMMFATAYIMLFVAGMPWRYVIAGVFPVAGAIVGLILIAPHRIARLTGFVDPFADRDDKGFQLIQSLTGFAQGGIMGRGAGASEQKLSYLFAAHTDFIFAVIGEELGLLGTLSVAGIFLCFGVAAFRVAAKAPDCLGMLLASGIGFLITFQGAFIMAVSTGLLPTKGLPLPFISYGGTALIMFMGMAGVLLNVSLQSQQPESSRKLVPAA
ncbi:MAG: putative lipid II flippase FtsW [Candidatus Hydrogenedentes bacterium]|nr:putative lipid II flippase FtsW [Candidatus Hydrogenedentota bacterium]